jgi:hypothetical protein
VATQIFIIQKTSVNSGFSSLEPDLFFNLRWHRPAQMYDQSIEKIAQNLIATFHVFWMILASEKSGQLARCNPEIDQFKNFHNFVIAQF